MSVSIDEFQKGIIVDGASKIVLDFLRSHRDQAFSQEEIMKGVNPNPTPDSFIHFLTAMAPLQLHVSWKGERYPQLRVQDCITGQSRS